jgi:prepilin-type N-terminal cleavage/methylation domain-containing protein
VQADRQRGFSLVEVLVALLILTLVVTTTLAIFLERNRRLQQANETILVWQALANEVELERRVDFHALASQPFLSPTAMLAPLAPYTANVVVTNRNAYVKDVAMTITWKSGAKRAALAIPRVDTGGSNLW